MQTTEIEFTKYYLSITLQKSCTGFFHYFGVFQKRILPETSSKILDETVSFKMCETLSYKIQIVFFPETPNLLIVKA
ncbi:MAG: hypothetical protein SOX88_03690 [Treponema sp.]|nr:hypothetical protein [Treponema sp.]